jgi:hypothetical protein
MMQYWQLAATYGSGDYGACAYTEGGQQGSCVIGAPTTGDGGVVPIGPPGIDYWVIAGLTLIAIAGFILVLGRIVRRTVARKRQRASAEAEQ